MSEQRCVLDALELAKRELVFLGGCTHTDRPDLPLSPETSWTTDVRPVLAALDEAILALDRLQVHVSVQVEPPEVQRPISKTVLADGSVVIEIADMRLDLTPHEARTLSQMWRAPLHVAAASDEARAASKAVYEKLTRSAYSSDSVRPRPGESYEAFRVRTGLPPDVRWISVPPTVTSEDVSAPSAAASNGALSPVGPHSPRPRLRAASSPLWIGLRRLLSRARSALWGAS